jgi:hypothetical protein
MVADVARDGSLSDRGRPCEHNEVAPPARGRAGCAFAQKLLETVTLQAAKPAEPFRVCDLEGVHRLVHLRRADGRNAHQEFRHPQCALWTVRLGGRSMHNVDRCTFS